MVTNAVFGTGNIENQDFELGNEGSFQGMAGLPNFVLIQRQGLAQQNETRKNITVTRTLWDFLEAECSNLDWQLGIKKKGNFEISPLLLGPSNSNRNIYLKHTDIFF